MHWRMYNITLCSTMNVRTYHWYNNIAGGKSHSHTCMYMSHILKQEMKRARYLCGFYYLHYTFRGYQSLSGMLVCSSIVNSLQTTCSHVAWAHARPWSMAGMAHNEAKSACVFERCWSDSHAIIVYLYNIGHFQLGFLECAVWSTCGHMLRLCCKDSWDFGFASI